MTGPPGCAENRGTLCVSPQKGTAGVAEALNGGCAAAARRALAPICRFDQVVARRSLHGLRRALSVPARQKFFWQGAPDWLLACRSLAGAIQRATPPPRGSLPGRGHHTV